MHVSIDSAACQGHGRCYAMAPDVYTSDDEGGGEAISADVPLELEAQAEIGALNCPESAITLA